MWYLENCEIFLFPRSVSFHIQLWAMSLVWRAILSLHSYGIRSLMFGYRKQNRVKPYKHILVRVKRLCALDWKLASYRAAGNQVTQTTHMLILFSYIKCIIAGSNELLARMGYRRSNENKVYDGLCINDGLLCA